MNLDELYQEVILDHYKRPRCQGCLQNPSSNTTLFNPLCGDQVELTILIEGQTLKDIAFGGHGCSISQASASMMSELCRGKSLLEVRELCKKFKGLMRGDEQREEVEIVLGDAVALEGVRKFSARVKCAMLAWEAIEKCLEQVEAK